jgi:hypothetical protein
MGREPFDRVFAVFDDRSSEGGRKTALVLMTGDDHCWGRSRASAQGNDREQPHASPADNEDGTISGGRSAQGVQRHRKRLGQYSDIGSEPIRDVMDLTCVHDDLVAPPTAQSVGEADRVSMEGPTINVFTGRWVSGAA